MSMLEISNPDVAREFIEQINTDYRILAPNVLFFIFTKASIINIINCFLLFGLIYAGWEVVDDSKTLKKKKDDDQN